MPGYADCVRLSIPEAVDEGPARLQFRGHDHPLDASTFTLGRDPSCNLVLEEDLYPEVAPFHCEIYLDRRAYTLRDRSRLGTLVNDRPVTRLLALNSGDWIRLGPEGPVLRFVGQPLRLRTVPR
jgi:pSer/pThr/pTyr-binding forkhead associated (FHA) protein